jgi:hypothetical protein
MVTPPPDERSLRTIIYFLVALVLALIGLLLIVLHPKDQASTFVGIGTSVLAGAIASIGFGLLRYIDDASQRGFSRQLNLTRAELGQELCGLRESVDNFAIDTAKSIRVTASAKLRCVSDLEIGTRFRAEYVRFSMGDRTVHVDVLGLKLYRFLVDQLSWMLEREHKSTIRLLLQNPYSQVFDEICEIEARNIKATRADIARTIDMLNGGRVEGNAWVWTKGDISVQLRFFDNYQPVTLFRVDDSIYVRPRISTPQGAASRFYEIYERTDSPEHFSVQLSHFDQCWREAQYSGPAVAELRTDLRQGA